MTCYGGDPLTTRGNIVNYPLCVEKIIPIFCDCILSAILPSSVNAFTLKIWLFEAKNEKILVSFIYIYIRHDKGYADN